MAGDSDSSPTSPFIDPAVSRGTLATHTRRGAMLLQKSSLPFQPDPDRILQSALRAQAKCLPIGRSGWNRMCVRGGCTCTSWEGGSYRESPPHRRHGVPSSPEFTVDLDMPVTAEKRALASR